MAAVIPESSVKTGSSAIGLRIAVSWINSDPVKFECHRNYRNILLSEKLSVFTEKIAMSADAGF